MDKMDTRTAYIITQALLLGRAKLMEVAFERREHSNIHNMTELLETEPFSQFADVVKFSIIQNQLAESRVQKDEALQGRAKDLGIPYQGEEM